MLPEQGLQLFRKLPAVLIDRIEVYMINQKINGKKEGVWKAWFEDGQLEYEGHYKEGKRHGIWKRWFEDGQLRYERNYKEDKWHGIHKGWFEDGQLQYEGHYKEGKRHG